MKGFENPEECLNRAAEAIAEGYQKGITSGHLCIFLNELGFHRSDHTGAPHTIITTVPPSFFSEGYNSKQWSALQKKLWNYYKEKI